MGGGTEGGEGEGVLYTCTVNEERLIEASLLERFLFRSTTNEERWMVKKTTLVGEGKGEGRREGGRSGGGVGYCRLVL